MSHNRLAGTISAISFAAAAVLIAAPAEAYQVTAQADTGIYIYGEYARGYNVSGYVGGSPGGPGFTTVGGGCGPQFASCSIGGSGNTQTSPNLTAATEAPSVSVTTVPSYYYPLGLTASGSAYATANLAAGSVGVPARAHTWTAVA